MKRYSVVYALAFVFLNQLVAMDARSEMMVRYYNDKPIVEKRSSIYLDHTLIKLDETSSVILNEEGLTATSGVLILDTFSLKHNPDQPYILLTSREVDYPSEPILLARKGNDIYILDLENELKIGQFTLKKNDEVSYLTLLKDTDGYTSLQINDTKVLEKMARLVYNGENYVLQRVVK